MPTVTAVETIELPYDRPFRWLLVRLWADDGSVGFGDASDSWAVRTTTAAIHELVAPLVLGLEVTPPLHAFDVFGRPPLMLPLEGFPVRTAASAVEMAAWDLAARVAGKPLWELFQDYATGSDLESVELYANLNRGLSDRSDAALARNAATAVEQGFGTVKIAPFDGIWRTGPEAALLDAALRRVEMVKAAIGDADLLVDAHGRLNTETVLRVVPQFEDLGVGWFEEPARFQEDPDTLLAAAKATEIPIAAGELLAGETSYRALIDHGATSIVMTDVKHNGGISSTLAISALCERTHRRLSLHNPTGPVSTLISAHVVRSLGQTAPLEYAVHEDRVRMAEHLFGEPEPVTNGRLRVSSIPGIGIDLVPEAEAEATVVRTTL